MKKSFILAVAALLVLACSPGDKASPDVPFVNPGDNSGEKQETPAAEKPVVTTGDATNITNAGAKIQNSYSGAPSSGVYDRGVQYGTAADALSQQMALNSSKGTSGTFNVQLISLESNTTYYYRAFITVWSAEENKYVDVLGDVKNFTTTDGSSQGGNEGTGGESVAGLQYLNCYEIPAIALKSTEACSGSGPETWGTTSWYNYLTTNDKQMVVSHTYEYNGKQYRNWTALVDKDKKAPLWSSFVMHDDAYPDNNVGRLGDWTTSSGDNTDPGIPSSWQQCLADSGYSRGHLVASDYRQACSEANRQTFYWTNQALQWQNSFNSGIWSSLENDVKKYSPSGRDTLYVTVGLLYEGTQKVVKNGAIVPSHFYKCLMKCSFDDSGAMTAAKGCAYLFTNEAHSGNYSQGITTIDAIEQRSGWDFFTNVPKELQDAAESSSKAIW